MHRRKIGETGRRNIVAALLGVALFGLLMVGCSGSEAHQFAGAMLEDPQPVPDFTLIGHDGRPVNLSDFRGQYVFLYFGYTYCPDFCPTTLAKLARVRRELGDEADAMQVIMITVDPERDTHDVLGRYVAAFDPTFVGLTGTTDEIDAAGEAYGLFYERHEGSAATGYLVDHSTRTFLIDPEGRALIAYPHDATPEAILSDLRHLLAQGS